MRLFLTAVALAASLTFSHSTEIRIISHGNGGIYMHSRILARHLETYIPATKVIPQIMTGAGGVVALNYLYNAAKKDGSEITTIQPRAILAGLFMSSGVKYDLSKFEWIGSPVDGRNDPFLVIARKDRAKLIGGSEAGMDISQFKVINHATGWNIEEISGYASVSDIQLAFQRGEITVMVRALSGIMSTFPQALTDQNYEVILQFGNGTGRHNRFLSVPTLAEVVIQRNDMDMIDVFERHTILSRSIVAPPNTDSTKLAQLRTAFVSTMKDQKYIEESAKIGLSNDYMDWQECQQIVRAITSSTGAIAKLKGF